MPLPSAGQPANTGPPSRPLRLGTRGSQLALQQAELVRQALQRAQQPVEIVPISTRGDRITDQPLALVGGKGLFVGEIAQALHAGAIDLAVHSFKDLPSLLPADGLVTLSCLPRADPRDVLVSRHGRLAELPAGARLGTSSPRRTCQLLAQRPDLTILPVRGNVDTRLRKLAAGDYEALVLAAAGLVRLDRLSAVSEWLAPSIMLPAAAQGALAVQVRATDPALVALLLPLIDRATELAVTAERAFVAHCQGDCTAVLAAYASVDGPDLHLAGLIGAIDGRYVTGRRQLRLTDTTDLATARLAVSQLGQALAADLLVSGGAALLTTGAAALPATGGAGLPADDGAGPPAERPAVAEVDDA